MAILHTLREFFSGTPDRVKIGRQYVGPGEPVFIIAEIGINHNGDIAIARELIDVAKAAGADAVKFQKRSTEDILTKEGRDKPYTSAHAFAPTYGEHRDKLEFSKEQYVELKKYCEEKGILFFASVWDRKSTDEMREIGIDAYKIPSADLMSLPLLEYVAKQDRPVLISTGMSTEEEIDTAVRTILPLNRRLVLFQCLSLYPSPEDKLNIRYMDVLRERYAPLPVGYSGHEPDLLPTLAAVARGACIVERHLTLDKAMKGSDHSGSLEPKEFTELVQKIRRIEVALGKPEKIVHEELIPLREKLAKSIVTAQPIPKGTTIRKEMLTIKSPGSALPPTKLKDVIGKIAEIDLAEDTLLPKEALNWRSR